MTYENPQVGDIYIRTIAPDARRAIKIVGVAEKDNRGIPISYKTNTLFDTARPDRVGITERTISDKSLFGSEWKLVDQNPQYTEEINIAIADAWQRGYASRPQSD
jgi:hypothetical protein